MEFVLASGSPRRKEILTKLNQNFVVIKSNADESFDSGLSFPEIVKTLAYKKAESVFTKCKKSTLGADTIVVFEGKIYGKPKDQTDALNMLKTLSGKTHSVFTGVAIITDKKVLVDYDESRVTFKKLNENELKSYIDSNYVLDKAGAYAVQDGVVVEKYEGSYSNVVGLPEKLVEKMLKEANLWQ